MGISDSTGLEPSRPIRRGPAAWVRELSRRRPLVVFAVLACLCSWWMIPITGLPLGSGVTIAAVAMLAVSQGRTGVVSLLRRIVQWRMHWAWYVAAVGLPILATGAAVLLTISLGAPVPNAAELGAWREIPATLVLLMVVPVFGPWEEPGFRGFGLTTARQRWPLFGAGLCIGAIQVVWHAPLFLGREIPPSDVVLILAASLVFAWLVEGSRGSVLTAMLMHATNNAVSGEYASPMFSGGDAQLLGWVRAGLWSLVALAVVVTSRRAARRRGRTDQ